MLCRTKRSGKSSLIGDTEQRPGGREGGSHADN